MFFFFIIVIVIGLFSYFTLQHHWSVSDDAKKVADKCKRIVEQYGESNETPERRLKEKDKRRAAYYQLYTDQKWGDRKNYDICVNTTNEDIKKIANILARLFKA